LGALVQVSQPDLSGREVEYVTDAVRTGWLTHHGSYEQRFEKMFSDYVGCPALATSSGTAALHLALLSLGIGRGDEVIVPALTFGATATVVLAVGAKPVLCDVTPDKWCLDKNDVSDRITSRTKAIIPVHLYGEDAGAFDDFGIPVIEDSCEALGLVPIRGDMACFSFYANKIITTGEGGMLVGDFGNAEQWRNGGFNQHYYHEVPGLNYRMTNMQGALGCAQMERIDELLADRLECVKRYSERLEGHGKWLFVAKTLNPQGLRKYLAGNEIDSRPVFWPLHKMPPFAESRLMPNAMKAWETGLCLPTGRHALEKVDFICDVVERFSTRA
jgi:perosamine synthetase